VIAKIVRRDKQLSDYGRLARYVVNAQGQSDPATWTRTVDYLLDVNHHGEKVGGVRITNCLSTDAAAAALEILATQDKNTRSRTDKTLHLVVSFPPGERPAPRTLQQIEDSLCAAIGFFDHQRISAVHIDTRHMHIHVAINRIHPHTFRNVYPWQSQRRLMAACDRLEIQWGLQQTQHGLAPRVIPLSPTEEHTHDRFNTLELSEHDKRYLRESYAAAVAQETAATTLNAVRTLSSLGVVRVAGNGEMLLPDHESDHLEHRGTSSTDPMRRPDHGPCRARSGTREGITPGHQVPASGWDEEKARFKEPKDFLEWVRQSVGIVQLAGQVGDWQAFHQALARYDLMIKPRGAGLVIVMRDATTSLKASEVARSLSLATLSARWGRYVAPDPAVLLVKPPLRGATAAKSSGLDTDALFADYQRARDAALQARAGARATLKASHRHDRNALDVWYRERRAVIKRSSTLRGPAKRAAYRVCHQERAADVIQRRVLQKRQREAINAAYPLPTWPGFVQQAAVRGDPTASQVLSRRKWRPRQYRQATQNAADNRHAHPGVVDPVKSPQQEKGESIYRLAEGAQVVDFGHEVRVDKATDEAVQLALTLAMRHFAGQALAVKGNAAFTACVVRVAIEQGMAIRFADQRMEQVRQVGMAEQENRARAAGQRPGPAKPTKQFLFQSEQDDAPRKRKKGR